MADFPEQCNIKLYSEMPNQITYRLDDMIYYSVISATTRRGRNCLTFRLKESSPGVEESILSHFELIWRTSDDFRRKYLPECNQVTS